MASPLPANNAVVELYNELNQLPLERQDRINQILWRLRQMHHKSPGCPETSVVLLQACIMAGKIDECPAMVDHAWGLLPCMPFRAKYALMTQLMVLGLPDRVSALGERLLMDDACAFPDKIEIQKALIDAAFMAGDINALETFAGRDDGQRASICLDLLDQCQARDHLHAYQEILSATIAGKFSMRWTDLQPSDTGAEIVESIFTPLDQAARRAMQDQFDDRIEAYLASVGMPPGLFVPTMTVLFLPLTACWQWGPK